MLRSIAKCKSQESVFTHRPRGICMHLAWVWCSLAQVQRFILQQCQQLLQALFLAPLLWPPGRSLCSDKGPIFLSYMERAFFRSKGNLQADYCHPCCPIHCYHLPNWPG